MTVKNDAATKGKHHFKNHLQDTITRQTRQESYITRPVTRAVDILNVMGEKEMTAREIAYALGFSERNAAAPRLTEMKKEGLVEVVGKRRDEKTEKNVAVWRAIR